MLILMFICSLRTQNYYCYTCYVCFVVRPFNVCAVRRLQKPGVWRGIPTGIHLRMTDKFKQKVPSFFDWRHHATLPHIATSKEQRTITTCANECQWMSMTTFGDHSMPLLLFDDCFKQSVTEWPRMWIATSRAEVVDEGFNPTYGARPLRRAIMRLVEDELAESFLKDSDQKWSDSGQLEGTYPPIIG